MDKKRRTKYQIAVYGIVGALGIILILISLLFNWLPVWQSIWINLGTGLLGVGVLFFLVDRFFLADEWGLSDRIDQLVKRLEVSDRPSAEAFFERAVELDDYFKTAVEISLCGVSLTNTINKHFGIIRERLFSGASIRLLLADPDSLALEMTAQRSDVPDDVDLFAKRLASSFKDIGYLFRASADSQKGEINVRLLPYAPSFGILKFKSDKGDQHVVIEIYAHRGAHRSAPAFVLKPERDRLWYEYFNEQFEQMWEPAASWNPQTQDEEVAQILQHRVGHVSASSFLATRHYLADRLLVEAQAICMSGFTLTRTTRDHLRSLEQCLAGGGKVRIMILEATNELLDESVRRSEGRSTPEHWRKRLDSTESLVDLIAKTPGVTGCLELGHLPYIPSYGIIMVDPDTDHGIIVVELYHRRSSEDNPTFELRADRDGDWYKFFRRQFDLMWESCRIEELPRNESSEADVFTAASASTT